LIGIEILVKKGPPIASSIRSPNIVILHFCFIAIQR
jgi:hypothetical protein